MRATLALNGLIDNIIYEAKVTAKLNRKNKIYFCIRKIVFMKHFPNHMNLSNA